MRLLPFLYSVLAVLEHGKGNKKNARQSRALKKLFRAETKRRF